MTQTRRFTQALYFCVVSATVFALGAVGAEQRREGREHGEREVRERRERERGEREEREERERRERGERAQEEGPPRGRRMREFPGVGEIVHQTLRRVPEEERAEVVRFIREYFEGELAEAEELARKEPGEAREIVTDVVHEARELLELREENPEAFEKAMHEPKLGRRSAELAERCRASKGEAREQLLKELRGVLSEAFGLRQASMKDEMRELERELQRLRTLVEKREENRDAIVERRIEQLTGEGDFLEW